MLKQRLLSVTLCTFLSVAAFAADDSVCPVKSQKHTTNGRSDSAQVCPNNDKTCENREVGVLNWLTDSHSSTSMHFIDFVEVFMH